MAQIAEGKGYSFQFWPLSSLLCPRLVDVNTNATRRGFRYRSGLSQLPVRVSRLRRSKTRASCSHCPQPTGNLVLEPIEKGSVELQLTASLWFELKIAADLRIYILASILDWPT